MRPECFVVTNTNLFCVISIILIKLIIETIETIKYTTQTLPNDVNTDVNKNENVDYNNNNTFYFENAVPSVGLSLTESDGDYGSQITSYSGTSGTSVTNLTSAMNSALSNPDKILLLS